MKNWGVSLLQGFAEKGLSRSYLEGLAAVMILFCAVGLFFGQLGGQGTVKLDEGRITYTGSLRHHKMDGQGKLTFDNGDTYEGTFKNGMFNGHGTFKAAAGWTYVGQFKNGLADGQGKLTTETKTVYEGKFKEGIYQDAD